MLKIEEILVGASYEVWDAGDCYVCTVVAHLGHEVRYGENRRGHTAQIRVKLEVFAAMCARRVWPCTVYLPVPEGGRSLHNQLLRPAITDPMCLCDNCGHQARHSDLPKAKDLELRLDPGGEKTDVECPECGCLCYALPSNVQPLTQPLTKEAMDDKGWVKGVVEVKLGDVVGKTEDELLDFLSEKLVGNFSLADFTYHVVGYGPGDVLQLLVSGDAQMAFAPKEGEYPAALVALAEHTNTKPEEWKSRDGPRSGVGEDYYYWHGGLTQRWWVCMDQGEVSSMERVVPGN